MQSYGTTCPEATVKGCDTSNCPFRPKERGLLCSGPGDCVNFSTCVWVERRPAKVDVQRCSELYLG